MLIESDSEAVLVTYNITDKDIAGPFHKKIPEDFRKKAAMERLGYTSPEELLAEKFHMSQDLLRKLNPGASFDKAEQEIVVANVEHESLPGKISRIEVDADAQRVKAYDKDNNIVVIYPATVGSEDRPTPKGEFKVTAEALSSATLDYEPLPPLREGLCGAPAPVLLKTLGGDPKVAIDPPATVTCALAKALSAWINECR
jgi:hypothetical protein